MEHLHTNLTVEHYKDKYFVTNQDIEIIKVVGEEMALEISDVFSAFFVWLDKSEAFKLYSNPEFYSKLQEIHWYHWAAFFQGQIDADYVRQRQEYGALNADAGLPVELFYSSILAFSNFFEAAFKRCNLDSFENITAFNKLVGMDTAIAMESYTKIINGTILAQNEALKDMSTPITQLWNGILLLPLVGIIDSKRAQDIMTAMLNNIALKQSKSFILDISGIAFMDTAVANHLIKMTKAGRLMGCTCIISGISAAVAQTIVELGILTEEIETTGTMQDALNKALRITGSQIVNLKPKTYGKQN